IPDLRPQPRAFQEVLGDVPQGIALANYVALRMSIPQGFLIRQRGQGEANGGAEPEDFPDGHGPYSCCTPSGGANSAFVIVRRNYRAKANSWLAKSATSRHGDFRHTSLSRSAAAHQG